MLHSTSQPPVDRLVLGRQSAYATQVLCSSDSPSTKAAPSATVLAVQKDLMSTGGLLQMTPVCSKVIWWKELRTDFQPDVLQPVLLTLFLTWLLPGDIKRSDVFLSTGRTRSVIQWKPTSVQHTTHLLHLFRWYHPLLVVKFAASSSARKTDQVHHSTDQALPRGLLQ